MGKYSYTVGQIWSPGQSLAPMHLIKCHLRARLPEGTTVAVVPVLSLLTLVISSLVSSTQIAQVCWETVLVGTRYTTLPKEPSNG